LMENGFQGKEGQHVPEMTDDFVALVSNRYQELYEKITGKSFNKVNDEGAEERIYANVEQYLATLSE
ncbi:phosphoribosylaminoimidazolesuccinocarboxamide synthase, partial [Schleiferiaceae bacterium]|nr:phosphoribosylaminoimidazolesuccinocarboxamide synthase [Schleiferiaceae bacterium]